MLRFIKYESGILEIRDELGDAIGALVKDDSGTRLSLHCLYGDAGGLRQIAAKLDELNGK